MKVKNPKYIPYREWYFEGYTRQNPSDPMQGRSRGELIYQGDYYQFQTSNLKKDKGLVAAFMVMSIICVAALLLIPSACNRAWPGIVNLLLVVPLLFLGISTVYYLGQKPPLTVRQLHSGYYEMSKWLTWNFMLCCIASACMIVYWAISAAEIAWADEIWMAVIMVIYIAVNRIWLSRLNRAYPVKTIQ